MRTPEKLTQRQRELLMEIAKDGGEAVDVSGSEKRGLFKRFKLFKKD